MRAPVLEWREMAKKAVGRPKGDRDDIPVKLDRKLATMAKVIATARGVTMGEYLSGLTTAPIHRDFARTLKDVERMGGAK